ncbi:TspO/MBR family protein [Aurantimonas sp. Leaf443]|uniref:TspO/MBR family protein n=1 Tax=Aurantimonas sp. Leaf443 TaxID=1736378 RepID=UPI0006FC3A1D|nr:TspO/MBR family protein [Aurantimonas sp. Leaf443]KQT83807.1 sensor histidine kinase [Aurantimonas sp. Leaf443]
MKRWGALLLFLLVSLGGGLLIGANNVPGGWYEGLNKPWFNPPDWVFAPAWTVLYILIAIAGWRVWRTGESRPKALWALQMALNFAWSPLFFTAQAPGLALAVILALLAAILGFLAATRAREPVAFWCFVPYAAWVAYASLLNLAIVRLN